MDLVYFCFINGIAGLARWHYENCHRNREQGEQRRKKTNEFLKEAEHSTKTRFVLNLFFHHPPWQVDDILALEAQGSLAGKMGRLVFIQFFYGMIFCYDTV